MDKQEVFARVDHTQLRATATWEDIRALCEEAVTYGMATVCIPPSFVKAAHAAFPQVKVCTVIGFPLGYNSTLVKVFEAQQALREGAAEIDMVVNQGEVKMGHFFGVTEEIRALKAVAGERVLKVIVETCSLNQAEKIALCGCVANAGADFIKTSTGFGAAGADIEDIRLFRQHLPPWVRIKASGGIRTAEAMEALIAAGADRIGASSAVKAYEGRQ
ncbi:MAG: deoxyribose-phosphate aldolase [Christensenellales bacterium]